MEGDIWEDERLLGGGGSGPMLGGAVSAVSAVTFGGGGAGGSDAVLCKITGGSAASGFTADIYPLEHPVGDTPEETGVLIIPDLAMGSEIPSGTWIIGHLARVKTEEGD